MAIILFADNDPDFLETRRESLAQDGYTIISASNPAEARRRLEQGGIDLAVLDIRMLDDDDEMDVSGLTLAKDPAYRAVPKIILTGFPSVKAVRDALGPALDGLPPAVDFLAKKEGPEALIQAIKRALETAKADQAGPIPIARRWQSIGALFMLGGIFAAGILAIVGGNPNWFWAVVAFSAGYAVLVWWPVKQ